MKFILFGIVLTLFQLSTQDSFGLPDDVEQWINECITESGVDRAIHKKFLMEGTLTDDHNLKCYLKCMAISSEVMDQTGAINFDIFTEMLIGGGVTGGEAADIIAVCKDVKVDDPCETAYSLTKCVLSN